MSIRLSEKHGLNPCIPVCFFCGKEKNEVALLGKLKDDAEAPMHAIIDYEPCDECKKAMASGILMIGVKPTPSMDNQPPISRDLYPTGKWIVVSEDFIRNNINNEKLAEAIITNKKTIADDAIVENIISEAEKLK